MSSDVFYKPVIFPKISDNNAFFSTGVHCVNVATYYLLITKHNNAIFSSHVAGYKGKQAVFLVMLTSGFLRFCVGDVLDALHYFSSSPNDL